MEYKDFTLEWFDKKEEYSFLKTEPRLQRLILLGVGGSWGYGTNKADSDIDLRGICLNSAQDMLTNQHFDQFVNEATDTTIYSFNKILTLLANCNPNTIELLGLENYAYLSDVGQWLVDNAKMFLSKKAVHSFGGYANAQLRRLDNKSARDLNADARQQHILNSIHNAEYDFKPRYLNTEDQLKLYVEDGDIWMDTNFIKYPLRDYVGMWSEMKNIVREYDSLGQRNKKAIEHGKLAKHQMHLVRLYLMAFDILEKEKIITKRPEHDFLMSIRNGEWLDETQPTDDFMDLVNEYEKRLKYAAENTSLPDQPDYKQIQEFQFNINKLVVTEGW